jgi:hypothetical protein
MIKQYVNIIQVTRQVLASVLMAVVTTACVSQIPPVKDSAEKAIGSSISLLFERIQRPGSYVARSGGKIRQYRLENGNSVYVEPVREGCAIHWEVNSSEIIIGYRTEGTRCF